MTPQRTSFPDAARSGIAEPSIQHRAISEVDEYEIKNEVHLKAPSADSLLATELNKLTFRERESINDEIHGINIDRKYIELSGAGEETPELLSKSLDEMQAELDQLCSTEGGLGGSAFAFQRSQELYGSSPEDTYFNTADFRLLFIRCEHFDCKKAAIRLCKFAEYHLEVFGDFALRRPIRFSDLEEGEAEMIKNGYSCPFSKRDRAGRRIHVHFARDYSECHTLRWILRINAYLLMNLVTHDAECQKKGFVAVMWMHNLTQQDIQDFIRRGHTQARLLAALPLKVSAGHYCFPSIHNAKDIAFSHLVQKLLITKILPHVRVHSGKFNLYEYPKFYQSNNNLSHSFADYRDANGNCLYTGIVWIVVETQPNRYWNRYGQLANGRATDQILYREGREPNVVQTCCRMSKPLGHTLWARTDCNEPSRKLYVS